jgi:hypothetical protein
VTIFELIKVEILLNLFLLGEFNPNEINKESTYIESTLAFVKRKPGALVNLLADMLPLLSIDPVKNRVLSGVKDATKSVTGFLSKIKELKIEKDEEVSSIDTKSQNYIDHFIKQKGTHLEFDLISEIIFKTIEKSEKKFVLVVDDLDRLDPAHIFRILNIFSAHNNYDETNKFGFDKVITVCDLGNVERIYKHFYGAETNFRGYIDKFVSFDPYKFENFENIYLFVKENNDNEVLRHFNLVISCIVYDLILIGKTDLRCLKSAFNYQPNIKGEIRLAIGNIDLSKQPLPYFIEFIKRLLPLDYFKRGDLALIGNIKPNYYNIDELEYFELEKQLFRLVGYNWPKKYTTEIGKIHLSPIRYTYQFNEPSTADEFYIKDFCFTSKEYDQLGLPERKLEMQRQAIDKLFGELRSVIHL